MKKILFLLSISTVMLFTNAASATIKAGEHNKTVAAVRERIPIKVKVYAGVIESEGARVENADTRKVAVTNRHGEAIIEVKEGDVIVVIKGDSFGFAHITIRDIVNGQVELTLIKL